MDGVISSSPLQSDDVRPINANVVLIEHPIINFEYSHYPQKADSRSDLAGLHGERAGHVSPARSSGNTPARMPGRDSDDLPTAIALAERTA